MRCSAIAATLAAVLALTLPAVADASRGQISILQDDATLLGLTDRDPDEAMAEAKYLGADMVRAFVVWSRVSPEARSRRMPAGFDPADPDSKGYDWSIYDRFVERTRRNGLKVMLTLTPPIPYWASDEPGVCPHLVGGYRNLGKSCHWKPQPQLFGRFAAAAARRYAGRVSLWSVYNEPNLEHYLFPQLRASSAGVVDVAAKRYRSLWWNGWKAIARYDPQHRDKVLFGETAAISSPLDTLRAALCLDPEGVPFQGRLRELQGCSRPRKLPIGGFAIHPYAKDAAGSVFQRSGSIDSLPMGYLPRLHRLMDEAARRGRIPGGLGIYSTEFGFQSNPPDRRFGLSLNAQARAMNEADRLFFADPRVRSVAQFEIYDVPEPKGRDEYNTGLRLVDGSLKPSYGAYRMPLVASRIIDSDDVEVWGQVRPAEGVTRVSVAGVGASGRRVRLARPLTNEAGYFSFRVRREGAARLSYRSRWRDPRGEIVTSRTAVPGRPIRYLTTDEEAPTEAPTVKGR